MYQVFTLAVEENYMRINIADNLLKELKHAYLYGCDERVKEA